MVHLTKDNSILQVFAYPKSPLSQNELPVQPLLNKILNFLEHKTNQFHRSVRSSCNKISADSYLFKVFFIFSSALPSSLGKQIFSKSARANKVISPLNSTTFFVDFCCKEQISGHSTVQIVLGLFWLCTHLPRLRYGRP